MPSAGLPYGQPPIPKPFLGNPNAPITDASPFFGGPHAPITPSPVTIYHHPDPGLVAGPTTIHHATPDLASIGSSLAQGIAQGAVTPATKPAAQTAPQPGDFMTPAMLQYINQFRQSQAAQQQALNAGLLQAVAGLGERRNAAAQVAATVPGEYAKAYREATASQAAAAKNADFGHPTEGGAATDALITAANTQEQAAGKANQPLLNAGIAADYSQGRTALANTDMQNKAQLAQADQALALQLLQTQSGYKHDEDMARLQSSLQTQQYKDTHPEAAFTPEQLQAQARQSLLDKSAIDAGFSGYAEQHAVESSPTYQEAVANLTQGGWYTADGKLQKMDRNTLLAPLVRDPNVLKALEAHGLVTKEEVYALGGGMIPTAQPRG